MFTKRFRSIITAMLLVSMTTLSMPMGIVYGATTPVENQNKTVISATNSRTFVRTADAIGSNPKVEAEVKTLTAAEQETLKKIFGQAPVTSETISLDGGTTVKYYDKDGNLVGSMHQTTGTQVAQPPQYFAANGNEIVIASSDPVVKPIVAVLSADEQKRLTEIFGVTPVKSETLSLDGGMTITYFDKDGKKVGSYQKTTGTQMDIPGVYRDKDGNVIETSTTDIKPPVRPGDDVKDIAVWTQYYKDYLAYVGKLTDLTKKSEAWTALAKDIMLLSTANPGMISAGAMNAVLSAMTAELKKTYADDSYKLDLGTAQGLLVDASLNFIKSDAFKKMGDSVQMNVAQNFMTFAIELSWRSANNTKNENLYPKIAEFYKTMLGSSSAAVQARAFNQLVHLYCIAGWKSKEGNAKVAQQILKDALNIKGGVEELVTGWIVDMNSASLSAEDKGYVANALAIAIWQQKALNNASTVKMSDAALSRAATTVTTFLTGVNNGTTVISGNMRNSVIHSVGAALCTLVNMNNYSTNESQALAESYITLTHDSLTLGTPQGGSITVQTSVINVLTNLMARAKAKNVDTLAQRCQNVLLDEGFNVSDYITKTRTALASTKNADYGAWLAKGLANIGTVNLQNNTGKIAAGDAIKIVGDIKAWITTPDNLKNMRLMGRQASLYDNLASFLKVVYAKGSTLGTDANMQENIVAIFKTISGLKDSKVQKMANADLKSLAATLNANGFTDLGSKLIALL